MEIGTAIVGIMSFAGVLLLIFLNIPIAFVFLLVGFVSLAYLSNVQIAMSTLATVTWSNLTNYNLLAIPLFIVMGQFISYSGIGGDLYSTVRCWFGKMPGGLAITTIWGCGILGACTGSASTGIMAFGPVAFKPMQELNYSRPLILGSICAGSTLGSIIPPSLVLVILGILTEQPVGKLFMAGILPGILQILLYTTLIILLIKFGIWSGPVGPATTWKEKLVALPRLSPPLSIFIIVLGGIYSGFFTVTEAAGIGALASFGFLVLKKGFRLSNILPALRESVRVSCMMYTLIIGAYYLITSIALSGLNVWLIDYISSLVAPPVVIIIIIFGSFVLLGFIMPDMIIILLLIPFLYPLVTQVLGFNGIWFCVMILITTQIASITPPVGINLFLTQGLFKKRDVPLKDLYKGGVIFAFSDLVRLGLLIAFPQIILWLGGG